MVTSFKSTAARFMRDEDGVTLMEYAILAGLIAVVSITTIGLVGTNINRVFGVVNTSLSTVTK